MGENNLKDNSLKSYFIAQRKRSKGKGESLIYTEITQGFSLVAESPLLAIFFQSLYF